MFAPACYLWSVSNPLTPLRAEPVLGDHQQHARGGRGEPPRPAGPVARDAGADRARPPPPGDCQSVRPPRRADPGSGRTFQNSGSARRPPAQQTPPTQNPLRQVPGRMPERANHSLTFRGRAERPPRHLPNLSPQPQAARQPGPRIFRPRRQAPRTGPPNIPAAPRPDQPAAPTASPPATADIAISKKALMGEAGELCPFRYDTTTKERYSSPSFRNGEAAAIASISENIAGRSWSRKSPIARRRPEW